MIAWGRDPISFTYGYVPGDSTGIVGLFGQLKSDDLAILKTKLAIDANILNIIQHYGPNAEAIGQKIEEFYRAFYSKYAR
jgi:hypothetical protein